MLTLLPLFAYFLMGLSAVFSAAEAQWLQTALKHTVWKDYLTQKALVKDIEVPPPDLAPPESVTG